MAIWAALIPSVIEIINKVIPDPALAAEAKLKVLDLQQRGELAHLDADVKLALGQLEINKAEAEAPGNFKGGWRPAAGWVCVFGLGYTFIVRPLLPWFAAVVGLSPPPLPQIDTFELIGLLFGMLGLGKLRSDDKKNGVA